MLRKISTTVLAGALASIALAVPAHADEYTQLCVDFGNDGTFSPYVVETPGDGAAIIGLPQEPFPNSIVGCGAYDTANTTPTCTPQVVTREVVVADPTLVGKVSRLQAKVAAQRALIKRLRAGR